MDSFLEAYERENKIVWGRVDELEAEEKRLKARIEALEAALRAIVVHCEVPSPPNAEALIMFARKALEGKDGG